MKKTPLYALTLSALFAASCMAAPAVAEKPAAAPAPAAKAAVAEKPAVKAAAKPAVKASAGPVALKAAPGAKLTVNGDSTMHKWHSDAQSLSINAEVSGSGGILEAIKANGLTKLSLVADAASLHSPEGSGMDKNTRKTLETDKFPEISFSLASYSLSGDTVEAKGSLSIHGVAKDVVLTGKLSAVDGGVNVKGSFDLKMTDYGIKPPVMMLGTIKVADALSIDYDFNLVP